MFTHTFLVAAAIVVSSSALPAPARALTPDDPAAKRHAEVSLVAEHNQLVAGTTAFLGLHFKLEPHWHTYWLGTGEASGQLDLSLDLPAGCTLGPIQWPAPTRLVSEGDLLDHVYERDVTLILPVTVAATAAPGPVKITGKARYLICASACVFEDADLTLTTSISSTGTKPSESASSPLFRAARSRLPAPIPTGPGAPKVTRSGDAISIHAPGAAGLSFFPAADAVILADLVHTGTSSTPRLALRVDTGADESAPFRGVLEVRYPDKRPTVWYAVEPTPQQPKPATTSSSGSH